MQENNKSTKPKNQIRLLVTTALIMAITLIMKTIFYFIPVINGYGLELYIVGYVYGLLMIRDAKWTWTFGIITPWFLMVVPPSIANFYDLLLEYVAAFYIFLPIIFIGKYIDWSNNKLAPRKALIIQMLIFGFSMIAGIFLKLFIHTIAGVLWWTPGQWWGSFIFNLPIYGITLAVVLPVSLLVYKPLMKIRSSNIYY